MPTESNLMKRKRSFIERYVLASVTNMNWNDALKEATDAWAAVCEVVNPPEKMEMTLKVDVNLSPEIKAIMPNATFYSFKESGKWKYSGRGRVTQQLFACFSRVGRRRRILFDNNEKFPGMSTPAEDFIWVVLPDESCDFGYPLMLLPDNYPHVTKI